MRQSRVEIEHYSIVYFDRMVAFEAPFRWTSVKGGVLHASLMLTYEPRPTEFSDMAFKAQRYDWHTRRNNLRSLHETATYVYCFLVCVYDGIQLLIVVLDGYMAEWVWMVHTDRRVYVSTTVVQQLRQGVTINVVQCKPQGMMHAVCHRKQGMDRSRNKGIYIKTSCVFISSSVMLFNDQQGEANEELFVLENDGLGSLCVSWPQTSVHTFHQAYACIHNLWNLIELKLLNPG